MVDYVFDETESINKLMRENLEYRDMIVLPNSLMIDLNILFLLYNLKSENFHTMRLVFANIYFASAKGFFQENLMTLGKLKGFLWDYPGMYSLCVPYFPTNDFYFSGHLASCLLMTLEYIRLHQHRPEKRMFFYMIFYWVFMIFFTSTMMVLVRTHYVIDLVAGAAMGVLTVILAEKSTYFTDVLIFGHPKHKREIGFFKVCPRCGWLCDKASIFVGAREHTMQKQLHRLNSGKKDN